MAEELFFRTALERVEFLEACGERGVAGRGDILLHFAMSIATMLARARNHA